jgi:hypothetical protein
MATQVGARQQRSYAVEGGGYGVYHAPVNWAGLVQDFTDSSERNIQEVRGSNSLEAAQLVELELNVEGSIDTILQDGRLLAFAFNSGTESLAGAGSKLHLFAIGGSQAFPSASFENANTGDKPMNRTYTGVKFSKITLSTDAKDMLHFKGDWTGRLISGTVAAPTSVTANTTAPYVYSQGVCSFDGTAITEVKTEEVNLERIEDPQFYVASGTYPVLTENPDLGAATNGTIKVGFTDATKYHQWLGASGTGQIPQLLQTAINLQFIWKKTGSDFIELTVSGCKLKSASPDGAAEGTLSQTLNFTGLNRSLRVVDLLSGTGYYSSGA